MTRHRPETLAALLALGLYLLLGAQGPGAAAWAEGYSGPDGFAVVRLKNLERSGAISLSWGGILEVPGFHPGENCDENADQCYEPRVELVEFTIQEGDSQILKFLQANQGRQMFVRYNLPTFGKQWELVDARVWEKAPPRTAPANLRVKASGSRRNFVTYGRVLRLQREGTFRNVYEGLYLDKERRKVHPVSITSDQIALFLEKAMASEEMYYMGISVSYFPGFRDSSYDIFEINYLQRPALP